MYFWCIYTVASYSVHSPVWGYGSYVVCFVGAPDNRNINRTAWDPLAVFVSHWVHLHTLSCLFFVITAILPCLGTGTFLSLLSVFPLDFKDAASLDKQGNIYYSYWHRPWRCLHRPEGYSLCVLLFSDSKQQGGTDTRMLAEFRVYSQKCWHIQHSPVCPSVCMQTHLSLRLPAAECVPSSIGALSVITEMWKDGPKLTMAHKTLLSLIQLSLECHDLCDSCLCPPHDTEHKLRTSYADLSGAFRHGVQGLFWGCLFFFMRLRPLEETAEQTFILEKGASIFLQKVFIRLWQKNIVSCQVFSFCALDSVLK